MFEYDDGVSQRFWQIQRDRSRVVVRFGRVGADSRVRVIELVSDDAAEKHLDRMIAEKMKEGYVEHPPGETKTTRRRAIAPASVDGITVERGMRRYLRENIGVSRLLVREADDVEAATAALRLFREDLWTSDLFAALDGEFGEDLDGEPVRYTPSFASEVELGSEGPEFWFDAADIFETWPALVGDVIKQLKVRLREAGVQRAEIGKPKPPYAERAYVPEADWFPGRVLKPLDETWLPPNLPEGFPAPVNAPVVVANRALDETWTSVAWRRQNAQDEFHDAHALWRDYGLEIVPMTEPPRGPPDIARGWRRVHSPFILNGYGSHGWAWTVFSKSEPATDLHVVWFDADTRGRTEKLQDAARRVNATVSGYVSELRPPRRSRTRGR